MDGFPGPVRSVSPVHASRGRGNRWPLLAGGLVVLGLVLVLMLPAAGSRRLLQRSLLELGGRTLSALPPAATERQRSDLAAGIACVADTSLSGEADPALVGKFSRAARAALVDGQVSLEELEGLLFLVREACPTWQDSP